MTSVLFICKERSYDGYHGTPYGLINSCRFVANYLNDTGIKSDVITVIDNNCIDREVTKYKPTHVIIEALWVVPEKFKILAKLHPKIKWIVRIHSKAPFLANEGIAIQWVREYLNLQKSGINIQVAVNNKDFLHDLHKSVSRRIIYLPNIYYPKYSGVKKIKSHGNINVASFGAIRIQKNQLEQAIAAIIFANKVGRTMNFHMNSPKIETKDMGIIKNIKALFRESRHNLILHSWKNHKDFLDLVKSMDLGLQVSFTESFNIVTADFVYSGVPIIVSPDVDWVLDWYKAKPTDTQDIVNRLMFAYRTKFLNLHNLNKCALKSYNKESKQEWISFLQNS